MNTNNTETFTSAAVKRLVRHINPLHMDSFPVISRRLRETLVARALRRVKRHEMGIKGTMFATHNGGR